MKRRNLIILVIAAAVLVGAAVMQNQKTTPRVSAMVMGRKLLPDLDVNSVSQISLRDGENSITVTRTDDGWVLVEQANYPARFDAVRDALIALADSKISDTVTFAEQHRAGLGMADPDAAEGAPVVMTLQTDAGTETEIWLGAMREKEGAGAPQGPMGPSAYPDGRYVSLDQGTTVYLLGEMFHAVQTDAMRWIETELLNVAADQIAAIQVADDAGQTYSLTRSSSSDDWGLSGLSSNETLKVSAVSPLANGISWLNLSDIAGDELDDTTMGFDAATTYTATTFDGRTYTITLGSEREGDGGVYARLSAAFTPPPSTAPDDGETADDEGEADTDAGADTEKTAADIETQNAFFAQWTYVIPGYKAQGLSTPRQDIVDVEEPAAETEAVLDADTAAAAPGDDITPPEDNQD